MHVELNRMKHFGSCWPGLNRQVVLLGSGLNRHVSLYIYCRLNFTLASQPYLGFVGTAHRLDQVDLYPRC